MLDLEECFSLTPHMEKRFEQMSTGTRRTFYLTAILFGAPRVNLADEPTGGLDGPSRAVPIDLFAALGNDRCELFSTHDDELAEGCGATALGFPALAGNSAG